MGGLNLHIYPSLIGVESRIVRITKALEGWSSFDHIVMVAMQNDGQPASQGVSDRRRVVRTRPWFSNSRQLLLRLVRFLSWYIVTLRRFRGERIACVNSHSLSTLPLGWAFKKLYGAKLIYDTHELETETLNMKGLTRILAKIVERIFIGSADATIVVGPKIADWYSGRYPGINPAVVRNLPQETYQPTRRDLFRERLGIPAEALVFFYQGQLSEGRGVETTLAAFARVPPDRHVVFLGFGPKEAAIRAASAHHPNVHFLPAVPPDQVRNYTQSGDIGLCLIEPDCLSYFYCLPNKLFEYIGTGVPVIATKLPELSAVIDSAECGWTVDNDSEALAQLISRISWSDLPSRSENCIRWTAENNWEKECEVMQLLYSRLGFAPPPSHPVAN